MFQINRPVAPMKAKLKQLELEIAGLRAEQVVLVNELERSQAPLTDASRSMVEYVQAATDIDASTASDLVFAARRIGHHRRISNLLADARISFARATATTRYAETGATSSEVSESLDHDLAGVGRMTATRRSETRLSHTERFARRYVATQSSLDRSHVRIWGQLPGLEGRIVERALHERADALRLQSPDIDTTTAQRQADALAAMAQDSLDHSPPEDAPSRRATATVFVDARSATRAQAPADAELVAEVEFGPRVGPDALEGLLCNGSVRVVGIDDGSPVTTSPRTRAVPPALREWVAHRDGGCTIDGCRSRYRLQPHHVVPFSHGGDHAPENLTTLCWYHHHVAIHGSGYRIDPDTPPHRRRLYHPDRVPSKHDPP